ncbi:unnamed protein product [Musa acuminata subsp. malaccensis]|uniref:(wild Malaysian banana) hypothetical protein n=1 Tax=Musa acuminata subsp. malaccensis TaxID=214687 RepID=A0A804IJP8_MUSAM|nr:PREDICTED: sister chromatid cohesion 1 protein 3-like isoform X2 [Musa acuminata subsp. malaccensis]CAG1840854.1 unnamed protein product [Musa acuminata subsp. malaccensis]
MFYSHTFLAKKSPLGTVWIAAHLERRIKKPQIDAIDIPSYAECIMFPEVPIALRLSGHLLLGLVRIYSWKVNYLFRDCNRMLTDIRIAVSSIQVNLLVDADRAPFESVTLPETFELDALELDESVYQIDGPDNHRKDYEQITLTDEFSLGQDQYVAFYINEGNRTDSSTQKGTINVGAGPMVEDVLPPFDVGLDVMSTPVINSASFMDPGSDNQANSSFQTFDGSNAQEFPDIEVMREAVHNSGPESLLDLDDTSNDLGRLSEHSASLTRRKDSLSPILEDVLASGEESLPSPTHAKAPTVASVDNSNLFNREVSLDQPLPDLELQPSPPVREQNTKRRKRKQLYDEKIVLSNAEIKKQLEDTTKLVCKRRKLPCSHLDIWRFHRKCLSDQILYEPLLSGMCYNLQESFKRCFPLSSNDSGNMETSPGPGNASSDFALNDLDMEPEQPRFDTHIERNINEMVPSPSAVGDITPFNTTTAGSGSDFGRTFETEILPTLEMTEPVSYEPEASLFPMEEESPQDHTPKIPSLLRSAEKEDLFFLEASNASSGHEGNEPGSLSARTRAVAQYLKDHSPSQSQDDLPGVISMNNILEGKSRKQCARMFFESLVLKNYGLIDVRQEEAYGDILISPMPALLTAKFE